MRRTIRRLMYSKNAYESRRIFPTTKENREIEEDVVER